MASFSPDLLPSELAYEGEFGTEVAIFLPFVFWLWTNGLLGRRRVLSYRGMEPFYYFLPHEQFFGQAKKRRLVTPVKRPSYLPQKSELTSTASPYFVWPNYKQRYQQLPHLLRSSKPIIIINNKFCREWNRGPTNYIHLDILRYIFSTLSHDYQLIYIREGIRQLPPDYSQDHNSSLNDYHDDALLTDFPSVRVFDDDLARLGGDVSYNELKLRLFSNCNRFISSQGGGSYVAALFPGSVMALMHRAGREICHSYLNGFFSHSSETPPKLLIATNDSEMARAADALGRSIVRGGLGEFSVDDEKVVHELSPASKHDPSHSPRAEGSQPVQIRRTG